MVIELACHVPDAGYFTRALAAARETCARHAPPLLGGAC